MSSTSPRIAAVRVQNQWQARTPRLRCVARLTRPLTLEELERMGAFPDFMGAGDLVTYTCRPEEVEESEKRLLAALEIVSAANVRRARIARLSRRPRVSALRPVPR